MAAESQSFHRVGSLVRSRSEGTLIDLDDAVSTNDINGGVASQTRQSSEWLPLQPEQNNLSQTNNPFWHKLTGSNPFLDDIVHNSAPPETQNGNHASTNNGDTISTSSDEGSVGFVGSRNEGRFRSGRCRSASHILEDLERKAPKREVSFAPPRPVLSPDFEWLKNDREAYKMAWLSHRQLTRSCLDLNLISQSPGWAQTQATNFQVISRIGHSGGSVRLADSDISIHIPQGHVPPGEVQEVTLKAMLDPPPGLNNNYMTTMSPLLEVVLSNINTKECISLEVKLSGEVKTDPSSQVMTTVVALWSNKRDGPYVKVNDCHIYKNKMEMKLRDLKTHFYVIAVAEASALEPPATSVWDYLDRQITVALYGPRFIHPSFKVVIVVCCHESVPSKLPFSDIQRGNKHVPPLVLQLWGTHRFRPEQLTNLFVAVTLADSTFRIRSEDKLKEVRQSQLKIGTVVHLPVAVSCDGNATMNPFKLDLQVKESGKDPIARFQILSPPTAPIRSEKRMVKSIERRGEASIPEESVPNIPQFKDRPVHVLWYAVAMKSVLRQPRVEYLLEYFKGDTVALLSKDRVRSVGNFKEKDWYIGFLRGRTGLIHCRNVKLIGRDQVMDFTGIQVGTEALLDHLTLPFNKLTYMYSAIQTLITEHISSWKVFADALGYHNLSLDTITRRTAETEEEKVACVLEKLKEDCSAEKSRKKFLRELMVGLLKINSVHLVTQLIQNTVILSTAVELGVRWRELAEKMAKLSHAQIAAYEAPHLSKNGVLVAQAMWKPAYDFLFSWSQCYGDGYKDMIQDLHLLLDKMKNPVTRQWRQLTGALITVNCLDVFCGAAYPNI